MSLLKPTVQMPFHIDFDWWTQNDNDWHVFLRSLLCPEHQQALAEVQEGALIDWVDPHTAEVQQVDGIQHALMTHCALQPDFVDPHTAVVEAVFRLDPAARLFRFLEQRACDAPLLRRLGGFLIVVAQKR